MLMTPIDVRMPIGSGSMVLVCDIRTNITNVIFSDVIDQQV
jgi:hypothetical protein